MKRRILIADEADLMLVGIQTILKDNPACEVVATVRSASELLETCKQMRPEVIILNEQLDTLVDVLALVERLKHVTPQSRHDPGQGRTFAAGTSRPPLRRSRPFRSARLRGRRVPTAP